ncbi:MAG TPA: methyltransferase [Candidatus Methylomirabilis sp.]|nr:methyltransferase [Candidatus Methylomirabilis sp.]
MTMTDPENEPLDDGRDHLCVDAFVGSVVGAQALETAFQLRLIDYLGDRGSAGLAELAGVLELDAGGLRLLLDLLMAHQVVEESGGAIRLTKGFARALRYRDLLEARLEFARIALPDFVLLLPTLVRKPGEFQRRARIFGLFDYAKCIERTPENAARTLQWVRMTTALTRYEAPVCMRYHDFGRYRRMLDIGGNSGEFALQVCRRHPDIQAVVFDLPVVCDVGRRHVGSEPEAARICFIEGNALTDVLPEGCDLITFKSMLHDWPEREARQLILRASQSLEAGGTLLIFERGPLDLREGPLPYSVLPFLLFSHAFRPPRIYVEQLQGLGFRDVAVQRIDLGTLFFLVTGIRVP